MASGDYYWIREIARGGMGRVDLIVRAEGTFRRLCAVKRLHPKLRDDAECRAMFLDEARIAGMLRHPNIVSVFDVGEDEEGPYLMMDFIEGLSVQSLIRRATQDAAPLPLAVVVQVVLQAAEGLHAAHELRAPDGERLNLVHRDVSPHNVLVGYDGIVRVMDFGIARALGRTTQTSTGVLKGKLAYMSPEQLQFRELDHRSDLFALGVILYEALTSSRLYPNRDGQGPRRILEEAPPDVGLERDDVPPSLVELVFQLLAKDPAKRPADAAEVAGRLQEVLNDLMLVDDEAIELSEYVSKRFESETTGHRREIRHALALLDEGRLPSWPVQEQPMVAPEPPSPSSPPNRWRTAALSLGFVAALAAGMYIGQRPSEDANTLPAVASPGPDTTPSIEAVVPTPIEIVPHENAATPTEMAEAVETRMTSMAARRRRRRERAAATMVEMAEPPTEMEEVAAPPPRDRTPIEFGMLGQSR